MARSATAARLRLLGPDELRPLMRESSVASTPKSSGERSGDRPWQRGSQGLGGLRWERGTARAAHGCTGRGGAAGDGAVL
jgi:hypothetical protein